MKKFMVTSVVAILVAATSQAQFKIGVKAGGNLSNQVANVSGAGSLFSGHDVNTWHAGLISEMNIGGDFYLQPQLLWTRKGASHFSSLEEGKANARFNYVEVPVNVLYKLDVSFGKVFGGAGAAFSYAVNGRGLQDGQSFSMFKNNTSWRREDLVSVLRRVLNSTTVFLSV